MDIGIVSHGLYTPSAFETDEDLKLKTGLTIGELNELGIQKRCLPSRDDQPVVMAEKAARQAFERAAGVVAPEEVDLVIWTGEEYKDYIAQTASIRLQEEVGCRNAWAFDLVGQNVTSIQGLRVARDFMMGDDTIRTILLAGGTRTMDLVNPVDPNTRFLLASSASGGAMLLRRGHKKNRLLGTAFTVDPDMADEVFVPGGGTEIPFRPDNLDSELMFFQTPHPERVRAYFNQHWTRALAGTAKKVLNGLSPDYVALRHLRPVDRLEVLGALGVGPEQSTPLDLWGCHGTNDVILSMELGQQSGAVRDHSLVLLLSGGIGFTYASAIIRWGPA